MSPEQLALPWEEGGYFGDWYRRVLLELDRVTTVVGLKEMAWSLDTQPSTLHHALTGRHDRQVQLRWLGRYLHRAPDLGLATLVVEPAGVAELARAKPRTPEEELARLREAIGEVCGPMIQQAINERARRQ